MSMAINRISASGVAAMLYPVMKPTRVAKIDTGRATTAPTGTSSQAVQGVSSSQSDESGTAEQVHTAFQYALAALSSVATTDTSSTAIAQSGADQVQSSGIPQAGTAYAQVEQQARQTLDLTA